MVRIQDDLFAAVNEDWLSKTEIPSDRPRIAAFDELVIENEKRLTEDLKNLSVDLPEDPILREAIKFYKKAGDFEARDAASLDAVKGQLEKVQQINTFQEFVDSLSDLLYHSQVPLPFNFSVDPDMMDAAHYVHTFSGPGLILPDTTYYDENHPRKQDLLDFWRKNSIEILQAFEIDQAEQIVDEALQFDALVVPFSNTSEEWAKYVELYRPVAADDFYKQLALEDKIAEIIAAKPEKFIIHEKGFYEHFTEIICPQNLSLIKSWMLVLTARHATPYLSEDLRILGSAFHRFLTNVVEPRNQEKQALDVAEAYFSQAIGLFYGKKYFGEEAKADVKRMVAAMIKVYQDRLRTNKWLSQETSEKAVEKLDAITPFIGYPDKLPEVYKKLKTGEGSLYEDVISFDNILTARHYEKFNEPVDKTEWHMPAHMVNAYYSPDSNTIVFPAAILQAPFYDVKHQTSSQNYGGIGAVIAHEISHAFDNNGAQFDKFGNLNKWWTEADYKAFEEKQAQMIAEFDGVETEAGKANGTLIVSENIADQGGITAALMAAKAEPDYSAREFFEQWAKIWRMKASIEFQQMLLSMDVHAPGQLRANIPPTNLNEFYEAFDVQPGDKMYRAPEKRVKIW